MSSFWRFTREMAGDKWVLVLALVFSVFSAGGLGAGILSFGPLLRMVLDRESDHSLHSLATEFNANSTSLHIPTSITEALPTEQLLSVMVILGTIATLTIVGGVFNFLHQYLSQTVTARTVGRIRQQIFDSVIHQPLLVVSARGPSDAVARIIRDTAELQRGLIALLSKSVTQVTKGMAALIVAVVNDWRLVVITIPTLLIIAVILRKLGKRIRRGTRSSLQASHELLRHSTETLQSLRVVKTSTAEDEVSARFRAINHDVVRHELRVRTARALSAPVVESIATIVILLLAATVASQILKGDIEIDEFVLTLGALGLAGASFRPLAGLVAEIQAAAAPAQRLEEIMKLLPEESAHDSRSNLPRHCRSIEFRAVSFSYPGTDRPAVDNVSISIDHGERVAFVGPSGSGKTSLLSLLPRLLVSDSGSVLIDGIDIGSVSLTSLRRQIGVVTQDAMLFKGTIYANIGLGVKASRELVIQAARRAHAHEFIAALPRDYETNIQELGASLSGGQRQRIAIARAILRDPAILILDEATSQIDAESEAHITAALDEFSQGRTTLIIAHRLSTVQHADRIVVLDAGRIIDSGSHTQLLVRCDLYARLARTQFLAQGQPANTR